MSYIRISKKDGKVYFENEKGKVSRGWGPRMKHKNTNIYKLAIAILGVKDNIVINTEQDTNYIILQPDLFLKSVKI